MIRKIGLLMMVAIMIFSLATISFGAEDISEVLIINEDDRIITDDLTDSELKITEVEEVESDEIEDYIEYEEQEISPISETYEIDYISYGEKLQELDILKGSDKGLELDSNLTRIQGMVIYFRMLFPDIERFEIEDYNTTPFADIPNWAIKEINFLYEIGLVKGVSESKLGSDDLMTIEQFTTLVLRALNYDDTKGEFTWDKSLDKAIEIGLLLDNEINSLNDNNPFTRGKMSLITYKALSSKINEQNITLLQLRESNKIEGNQEEVNTIVDVDEINLENKEIDKTEINKEVDNIEKLEMNEFTIGL